MFFQYTLRDSILILCPIYNNNIILNGTSKNVLTTYMHDKMSR